MNNLKKNLVRALALVLIAATLSLGLCSCGKNISEIEVIKSNNFSVSAGMVTYSLYDSYYYYVNYFGADMMKLYFGIDTKVSLKKQYSDATKKTTWFDVFKADAVDGFRNSLVLCEAAYADGVELSEVDQKYIQSEIDEIASMAAESGMSLEDYIEYIYTDGVTEDDIRKSLEIFRLANKKRYKDYSETIVTDGEINDVFKEKGESYLIRDVIYLDLAISNEDAKNEKIKEYAEKLKAAANEDDFKKIADEFIRSEYCVDSNRNDGNTENDKKVTSDKLQNSVAEDEKTELDKWLFSDDTDIGDTYVHKSATHYVVYMATSKAVVDASETRNIYTILFSADVYGSDDAAKAKAEEIFAKWKDGGKDMDEFKSLAAQYTTDYASVFSGGSYENVLKDDLIKELDTWLFDDARVNGDCELIKTDFGYHIIVYNGVGEPAWKVPVIEGIKETKTSENIQYYVETYAVTVIEGNMKYVKGE